MRQTAFVLCGEQPTVRLRLIAAVRDESPSNCRPDGVSVAVLHVPTIKPLDEATILAEVRRSGRIVVVTENHW